MSSEQKILYEMQILESYEAEMAQLESALARAIGEATSAIHSIRGAASKSDALVPVGHGAFLRASASSADGIILNIGSGVAIEKSADEAVDFMEARIKELEARLRDTTSRRHEAAARLDQGRQQMQAMMAQSGPEQ